MNLHRRAIDFEQLATAGHVAHDPPVWVRMPDQPRSDQRIKPGCRYTILPGAGGSLAEQYLWFATRPCVPASIPRSSPCFMACRQVLMSASRWQRSDAEDPSRGHERPGLDARTGSRRLSGRFPGSFGTMSIAMPPFSSAEDPLRVLARRGGRFLCLRVF